MVFIKPTLRFNRFYIQNVQTQFKVKLKIKI